MAWLSWLVVAFLIAVAGCASPTPAATSGIQGTAMIGPTCPVERDPPDPNCADKPYAGHLAVTSPDGARVFAEFDSASDGTFRVAVAPGTYQIRSASENSFPSCSADTAIIVRANEFTQATIHCDSGIR